MSQLFDDSDSDSDLNLKIENSYASNYNNWRQKEELNKLKTKYGESALNLEFDRNSETSSSEDDDEEEIPEEVEKQFFKTLASLKNKDPKIYDENFQFFKEPVTKPSVKKKEPTLYVKDYERKMILEDKDNISYDEVESNSKQGQTYVEEQNELKQSLKDALKAVDEDDADECDKDWGGIFKTRQKTKAEIKKEDEDYKQWLIGEKAKISDKDMEADLKPLKDYWNDPNLEEGEKFLCDYIVNKRFLKNEDENYIPTYEEIIHDSDEGLSEDEAEIEKQEEFEVKYNYRFEEPDEEFIKRYPRVMENSVRKQDDRRKIKRAEIKQRKLEEKKCKMEEIKQMQDLKRKEIEEKIEKLKEITGNMDMQFNTEDIEDDFDPDAHDKRMQKLFNQEFYEGAEGEQKPEFPDLDEELEIEKWDAEEEYGPHCEDEDFNMDCDYDPQQQPTKADATKEKRKKKRKSKFAKVVSQAKPIFDPNDKTYEEYLDEYYKLDCEDIIGDVPCRFKYRQVVPNDFGLSVEEILLAKDKELNRWCSIKKALQYRPQHVEKYDVIAFKKKAQNEALKKKYLPSLYAATDETSVSNEKNEENVAAKSQNKKKKKRENSFNGENQVQPKENLLDEAVKENEKNSKQSKKKRKRKNLDDSACDTPNRKNLDDSACDTPNQTKKTKIEGNSPTNKNKNKSKKKNKLNKDGKLEILNHPQSMKNSKKIIGKKRKPEEKDHKEVKISDARLTAYGFKPKKFKNKIKYGKNK